MSLRHAVAVLAAVATVGGIVWLRQVTMARDVPTPSDSRTVVVVESRTNLHDSEVGLHQITEAVMTSCRLEIGATSVETLQRHDEPDRFRLVLQPALDTTERRRYEGCLEDWRIDHLRIDVVSIEQIGREST